MKSAKSFLCFLSQVLGFKGNFCTFARILPDHLKVCLSGYSLIANGSDENACN
ncbi:hypothetical protein TFUB22_01669 [Tannerella forsythia]|nr:hypothetical protein TFUB22_01669 [Tannerella forsythia]